MGSSWTRLLLEAVGVSFLLATAAVQHKRMKRRRREIEEWVAPEIPVDVLMEILARLPAKSVMRFKCTSKFWSSLLCSRYFCNRFLMVSSDRKPHLYMCLVDRYNHSKSLLLRSAPATCPSSCLEFDKDLTILERGGYHLGVLRGFMCYTFNFKKVNIYNPSTRQLVILPSIEESDIIGNNYRYGIRYFICHDPLNDQYKLLCTITETANGFENLRSEHWVFVLEAGGWWKRVAKEFYPHLPSSLQLTLNGVLYYLAWTDEHTLVLVSFDMRSEELNMMQAPCKDVGYLLELEKTMIQIEYGGKVAVFDVTNLKETGTVDLWVVEDWWKKEGSRKTLVLQPWQMHLVTDYRVMAKGTKGKVIFIPHKLISPFYFVCYDLQINDLKKVKIKGIPNHWFSKLDYDPSKYFDMGFMDPTESLVHLET